MWTDLACRPNNAGKTTMALLQFDTKTPFNYCITSISLDQSIVPSGLTEYNITPFITCDGTFFTPASGLVDHHLHHL
jgi:hypothetical protein